jgi:hypothetical protein
VRRPQARLAAHRLQERLAAHRLQDRLAARQLPERSAARRLHSVAVLHSEHVQPRVRIHRRPRPRDHLLHHRLLVHRHHRVLGFRVAQPE